MFCQRFFGAMALAAFLALPFPACHAAGDKALKERTVQPPVVAGSFYPADPSELRKMVEGFISRAPRKRSDGAIIGLIVPHAGYQYSGIVAGAAYRQLEGSSFARVVVIAPSHHASLPGAALSTRDLYRTPLGEIPIDVEAVHKLLQRSSRMKEDQLPYAKEHSLEVQLPFLQSSLRNFKLVPLIVGTLERGVLEGIAEDLAESFPSDDTLFIASTDLSHYLPYEKAMETDRKSISFICERDAVAFAEGVARDEASLCGAAPVFILKRIAEKRGGEFKFIEYANSGDTAGDRSRVVGYAAAAAIAPRGMGQAQKRELIDLARRTLVAHVTKGKLPSLPADPILKRDGAAFVTLRKRGELRGCIGHIVARQALDKTVQEMAMAAATEDARFPPVRPEELDDIDIEISVLTAPEPLPDPLGVRVGTDGLIVEKGMRRGVLLPQVPTEQGWNRDQYLEGICRKAGLPPDCRKDATFQRFQAIVFGEKG